MSAGLALAALCAGCPEAEDRRSANKMKIGEPPDLGICICSHVFKDIRPILYVSRADGDWQFLCGGVDHDQDVHAVCIGHLTERDPTLHELADLKPDWQADREKVGAKWAYSKCGPE